MSDAVSLLRDILGYFDDGVLVLSRQNCAHWGNALLTLKRARELVDSYPNIDLITEETLDALEEGIQMESLFADDDDYTKPLDEDESELRADAERELARDSAQQRAEELDGPRD